MSYIANLQDPATTVMFALQHNWLSSVMENLHVVTLLSIYKLKFCYYFV